MDRVESPATGAVFAEEQGFVLDASGYDIEDGNDTIRGGEGADIIYPSTGNNTILDTSEEDVIY